ncbi:class I SAM-dependent methyltransferase [Halovenus marina]|uniref:class I SAM-dependent methyltransferase n=1 Tax=Halovenus marina TaxID=3396621 RepID=UPI003F547FED
MRAVYDRIATHFSKTRQNPWPEVESFLDDARSPDSDNAPVGLDVGCGNGRHTDVLSRQCERTLGVDVSHELLETARERQREDGWHAGLIQGEAGSLPVKTDAVDIALYVATLHHLPDRESRIGSLDELARVLTSDGRALVSAWSTTHDRFGHSESFDTTVDWTLPGGETVPRFYHIYAPDDFERDIAASALTIERSYQSSGNCYAEVSPERETP